MKYFVCISLLCCISSVLSADCESSLLEITKGEENSHDVILGMGLAEGTQRETNSGVVFKCIDKQLRACLDEDEDEDDCFKVEDCSVLSVSNNEIECGNSERRKRDLPSAVYRSNNLLSKRNSDQK